MFENENLGAEEQEFAEPAEDTSEESQEVANPEVEESQNERDYERDSAFAEMRRAKEEAERSLAEYKAEQEAREEAIANITGDENAVIKALAEAYGLEEDDVNEAVMSKLESAQKDMKIQELEDIISTIEVDKVMAEDLAKIQKIDPSIKDLNQLGESFVNYIGGGLSAEEAYWAIKAKENATKMTPPESMGEVKPKEVEKSFFTYEEVQAMTYEQQVKYSKEILESAYKW